MALKPLTRIPVRCVHTAGGPFNYTLLFLSRPELNFMSSIGNLLKPATVGQELLHENFMFRFFRGPLPVTVAPPIWRLKCHLGPRKGLRTSVAWSVLETSSTELPPKVDEQKPLRKPRKRTTKSKAATGVGLEESSPLQVPGISNRTFPKNWTAELEPTRDLSPWSRVKTWVVFSDLHVSRRTLETCLQILRAVHAEASKRDAGIIFLGDFWHARGALPVEILNVVIAELSKWSRPAVFIPGNHDQVNMGGQMHALMVLGAVNPLIRVFDEPVEFLGALWIPFRRDHSIINQALQKYPNARAIFAHLDVVGAFMNEACQAKEGVEPSVFPENIPVFTGHYHKPHVVDKTRIEYIGSPYQVSASETGQVKRFLLLDSSWEKLGSIPVDIGGRHFVVSHTDKTDIENMQHFRTGDRVRLLLSTTLLGDNMKPKLDKLQRMGVHVDLVFPVLSVKPRIEEAESLNAFGLFNLYAERVGMSVGAITKGVKVLRSMDLPAKLLQRPQVQLVLQSVEIHGFGPYLEPVNYPLYQRGVRVVCGRNMDSVGADSNGAGKSTLVMAPLWALSGSTDPRPDSMRGLSAADVIHEKATSARVSVRGTVNGKPFSVERSAGRKPSLKFTFDGEDRTGQDMRLTQAKIDEIIETSVLQRVAFHGQYGIGGLLEASDKDFKDELSKVVAMDLWVAAKKQSSLDLRNMHTEAEFLDGAITQLQQQKAQIEAKVQESKIRMDEWEASWVHRCAVMEQEADVAARDLERVITDRCTQYQQFVGSLSELENVASELKRHMSEMETDAALDIHDVVEPEKKRRDMLLGAAAELAVEVRTCDSVLNEKRHRVNDYKKYISGLQICDKCLQPVDSSHSLPTIAHLEEEVAHYEEVYKLLVNDHTAVEVELQVITKEIKEETRRHEEASRDRRKKSVEFWDSVNRIHRSLTAANSVSKSAAEFLNAEVPLESLLKGGEVEVLISSNKQERNSCESLMSTIEVKDQDLRNKCSQLELDIYEGRKLKSKSEQLHQALRDLRNTKNPYEAEYAALKSVLATIASTLQEKETSYRKAQEHISWLKELENAFSHTGVQSYVLEAALAELQERTARHLDTLSGGSLGLLLRPTKELKKSKNSVEAIDRIAVVRRSTGETEQRSLRQLSGGERRRLALAVALGFSEFAAQRSGLHCDLLVLDEVLQHLDSEGKARVVAVLKGLAQSTILLVSQTYGDVADAFDVVDVVVKENDTARIETPDLTVYS